MFSTVLFPTDLSPASERVAECAGSLVPLGTKSIVLLHALGLRHLGDMAPALESAVRPGLEAQARTLARTGVPVEVLVVPGVAHHEINRVARERRASLVLLGSQGANLANELRIGSVSLETLHRCEVPVLLVRVSCSPDDVVACSMLAKRILHPTDFSDCAERAFGYVRSLVRAGLREVVLLHVQDRRRPHGHSDMQLAEFDRIDRGRLDRLASELSAEGGSVKIEIASGSPIQQILRHTTENPDTLVVMGTQGRGLIPEVLLGSVSHAVARHAPAPVLLVPAHLARTSALRGEGSAPWTAS